MTGIVQAAICAVIFFSAVGLALSGVAVGLVLGKKYFSG
jgi:hypothetical protein